MDIGYFFLLASFASLVALIVSSFAYIISEKDFWKQIKYSSLSFLVFVLIAYLILLYYFLVRDFNVEYVFLYSDTHLPLLYTISATWAGREGSLLLWLLYIGLFVSVFVFKSKKDKVTALAALICGVVAIFFNILVLTSSNPFVRLSFNPPEGYGLNPLLRTPEMAFHPPSIFLGYAGMTIPFALAISATYYKEEWSKRARNYLLVAWSFLGIGILLGAWWAYKTLGWGGFWGWDPVENSSLLPWLTSSALLHGLIVEERKKIFKPINYALSIVTFDLVVLATFITRSGIINSVHAFARNQEAYLYLALIVLASLIGIIVAIERREVFSHLEVKKGIREYSMFANIFILLLSTVTILIGTLAPLLFKASVKKEFYRYIEIPLGVALVILLGVCVAAYSRTNMSEKLEKSLIIGILAGIITYYTYRAVIASIGFTIFFFSLTNIIQSYTERKINMRRLGALLAHLGLILLFIGVMGAWIYESSYRDVAISDGGSVHLGQYTLKLNGFNEVTGNGKMSVIAYVSVYRNGKFIGTMHPRLIIYNLMRKDRLVASVDIISTPFQDLYIAMGGINPDTGVAYFEFYVVPLVSFVWIGSILIIGGGIVAALPEFNIKRRESTTSNEA